MKPKLLVVELWALGDLALATPFLQAASQRYDVTLLAKSMARELASRFCPEVAVLPATLPWTAFHGKYRLWAWPWRGLFALVRELRARRFDAAVSARWEPRDHVLMWLASARERLGFSRLGSRLFLTRSLPRLAPEAHRYESWRRLAEALEIPMPPGRPALPTVRNRRMILVHTGAGQPTRVWPLERFHNIVNRLRLAGFPIQIACDANQLGWWQARGEEARCPASLTELFGVLDLAGLYLGNDSGPGHLAALSGVPTFTVFGNQFPSRFGPLHPLSRWIEGKDCPYKPCFDSCRFPQTNCLVGLGEEEVWPQVERFVREVWPTVSS